jgi:hypothetical protein
VSISEGDTDVLLLYRGAAKIRLMTVQSFDYI